MVTPEEIIKLGAELKLETSERIVQKTIEFYPEQIEKDPTGNRLLWMEQALIEAQIKNILVTNYNDSDEDLLIFNTSLSVEELSKFLEKLSIPHEDVFIVDEDEVQYYLYTPFFADANYDQEVKTLIKKCKMKPWNVKRVIPEVSRKHGSPIGRRNIGKEPHTITSGPNCKILKKNQIKVYDKKVPMCTCCGAYDQGGAYWGTGKELRVRFTADLNFIEFYRTN